MKFRTFLLSLLSIILTASCSDGNEDFADFPIQRDTTFVGIRRTVDVKKSETAVPLYIIETEGTMISEIYVPEVSDSMLVLCFMPENSNDDMTVLVTQQNIIMFEGSPNYYYGFPSEVTIANAEDNFSSLSSGRMNWSTGEFTMSSSIPLTITKQSRAPKKDDFSSIRDLLYNHLDTFSDNVDDLGASISINNKGEKVAKICEFWTKIVTPQARRMLYDYDYDVNAQETSKELSGKAQEIIISYHYPEDNLAQQIGAFALRYGNRGYIWAKNKISGYFEKEEESDYSSYESSGLQILNQIGVNTTRVNQYIFTGSLVEASKCMPYVQATDITENSITLRGSFSFASEAATSNFTCAGVGFTCGAKGQAPSAYPSSLEGEKGIASYTIYGLQPATTYNVRAYYKTFSGDYYSDVVQVTTRGILFELSNTKISFPQSGGSIVVNLTVGENTTYKVESAPKWVTTQLDTKNHRLLVKASESQKGHEAEEIILTATNDYGESTKRSITVSQSDSNWDGTTWDITINLEQKTVHTYNGSEDTKTATYIDHCRLKINSVANNSFSLSGDLTISEEKATINVDKKGNLIISFSGNEESYVDGFIPGGSAEDYKGSFTLSRKGSSIQGTYNYFKKWVIWIGQSDNHYETTAKGTVSGTIAAE